jgi:hypothetical protein
MHESDVLYHDECVKIGVKSIIVVNYDEQIEDNRRRLSVKDVNCYLRQFSRRENFLIRQKKKSHGRQQKKLRSCFHFYDF